MTATVSLRTARKKFDSAYSDPAHWTRMSILIMVRMGKFSCDRLIREYARDSWNLESLREGD
jgi:starch phosphorylase